MSGRAGDGPLAPRADAVTILTAFLVLLVVVPANLIFEPLGASGTPAAMLALALACWWANARLAPAVGIARGLQPVRIAFAVFACAVVAAYVCSAVTPLVPVEARAADRGLLRVLAWGGVVLVAADGIRDRHRLETLLRRMVGAGAVLAAAAIVQFWTDFNVASVLRVPGLVENGDLIWEVDRSEFFRPAATASHPLELGVVLAAIFPLALHFAFGRGAQPRARDRWAVVLIAFATPLSISRSAVLGMVVGLAVVVAGWDGRRRLTTALVVPPFVVGMRVLVPGLIGTIRHLFTHMFDDPSYTGRTDDYATAFAHVARSPLFGRGFGTFVPGQNVVVDRPGAHITLDNQYLGQLIETGIVGLVALVALLLTGYCCARGARRRSPRAADHDLGQAIAAAVAVLIVTFVTFDALSFPMLTGLAMALLGCAGASWRLAITADEPVGSAATAPSAVRLPTAVLR